MKVCEMKKNNSTTPTSQNQISCHLYKKMYPFISRVRFVRQNAGCRKIQCARFEVRCYIFSHRKSWVIMISAQKSLTPLRYVYISWVEYVETSSNASTPELRNMQGIVCSLLNRKLPYILNKGKAGVPIYGSNLSLRKCYKFCFPINWY